MNIKEKANNAIIISVSSDIGTEMAKRWASYGWQIIGTYRTETSSLKDLSDIGVNLIECDLSDDESVISACKKIQELYLQWDILVLCPGTQDPVGSFDSIDFDAWALSVRVNFVNQLRVVRELLPKRNRNNDLKPCVLFFAGGGTNNATVNYSAYTVSKIALIKMCELLDAEIQDTRFTILGPGWVKTKIHQSTLTAGNRAGDNFERTKRKLENNEFTPLEDVLKCCDWIIGAPRNIVSGRNFSVVFDAWGTDELDEKLTSDYNMYKLRRHRNDCLKRR